MMPGFALRALCAALVAQALRGHVVMFLNEPMLRSWWRAFDRIVLRSIVLSPSF